MTAPLVPDLELRVSKNEDHREGELGTWSIYLGEKGKVGNWADICDSADEDVARFFLQLAVAWNLVDAAAACFPALDNIQKVIVEAGGWEKANEGMKECLEGLRKNLVKIAKIRALQPEELLEV